MPDEIVSAKNHYENHLARIYEWMTGEFETVQQEQQKLMHQLGFQPAENSVAVDLGCGHGIHAVSLANLGFKVIAVDFNELLIKRLEENTGGKSITPVCSDILVFRAHVQRAELICCMGDTIAHLETDAQLQQLMHDCYDCLKENGKLLLSFRDYSEALPKNERCIPVRSDEQRILTCILDYREDFVEVTDLLHEKHEGGWQQHVSVYRKLRISSSVVQDLLQHIGFRITSAQVRSGMHYLLAEK